MQQKNNYLRQVVFHRYLEQITTTKSCSSWTYCKHRLAVESFRWPWLGNFFFQCQIWFWQPGISRPAPTTPFPHRFTSPLPLANFQGHPTGAVETTTLWKIKDREFYYWCMPLGRFCQAALRYANIFADAYCTCLWAYSDRRKKFSLYCKGTLHSSTAASSEQPALMMLWLHELFSSV